MLADWAIKRRTLEMAAKELCDLNLLTLQHRKGHHVFYHIPDAEIHAMLNPATEPDAKNIVASRPMPQKSADPATPGYDNNENKDLKIQNYKSGYSDIESSYEEPEAATPEIAGSTNSDPATRLDSIAKPQKTDIAGSTPEIAASMPQEIAGSDSFNPAIQEGETAKPQKPDFSEAEPTTRGIRSRNASTEGDAAKNGSPPLEEWTSEATAAQQQLQKACPALLQRAPGSYPLGPTPQTVNPKTCFQQTSHPQ